MTKYNALKSASLLLLLLQVSFAQWFLSWESGDESGPKAGAISNPDARSSSGLWIDSMNSLYIFGGQTPSGAANDLWRYSNNAYVRLDPKNSPSPRSGASCWTDSADNLWLYGGENTLLYPDLFKMSTKTLQWQQIGVANGPNSYATFGGAGSLPGSKSLAANWIDKNGNLWLFGGKTFNSLQKTGPTNDFWMYNISMGNWTWVGGNDTLNIPGINAVNASYPGGRYGSSFATDKQGVFWMFGGFGIDCNGVTGYLNDLWSFTPTTGQWTCVSGNSTAGTPPIYGHNVTNELPSGRVGSIGWVDGSGHFWVIGGYGIGLNNTMGLLNDLWAWNGKNWAWEGGDSSLNSTSVYGTEHSSYYSAKLGGRYLMSSVIDSGNQNIWVFGGQGFDLTSYGFLDDLWRYSSSLTLLPEHYYPADGGIINWTWPVIGFVLGGATCIGIGLALGYRVWKNKIEKNMAEQGEPKPRKETEEIQLDDLNLDP